MKRRKEEKTVLLLVSEQGEIALEKRPDKGLLSGMYQFPNMEGFVDEDNILQAASGWDIKPDNIMYLQTVKHVFTHIDWHLKGYIVTVKKKSARFLWATPEQLTAQYPLPTAFQKLLNEYIKKK